MFGKKKEKQQTENMVSEVNERTAIEILVTEEDKTGRSVIGTYNRRVSRFFDKGIVATDKSLAMFIHENIEYNANNIDCWYNFEQEMKPLLNSAYEELQAKEVYVITAEEDQKDVK